MNRTLLDEARDSIDKLFDDTYDYQTAAENYYEIRKFTDEMYNRTCNFIEEEHGLNNE